MLEKNITVTLFHRHLLKTSDMSDKEQFLLPWSSLQPRTLTQKEHEDMFSFSITQTGFITRNTSSSFHGFC